MKITFDTGTVNETASHMILALSNSEATFIWYNNSPMSVHRIVHGTWDGDSAQQARQLEQLLYNWDVKSLQAQVLFNHAESMLVPNSYQSTDTDKPLMDLFFGEDIRNIQFANCFELDAKVLYDLNNELKSALYNAFNTVNFTHTTAHQAAMCVEGITCIFQQQSLKVLVKINGVLQLVQYYDFETPTDAAYYLVRICEHYHIDRNTFPIHLSGLVQQDSNLFKELEKYFLELHFLKSDVISPLPEEQVHYFSHLLSYLD